MTKQTSLIIRITVFLAVFLTVMSISFLVEAQDMPVASVRVDERVPEAVEVPVMRPLELIDVTDGLASWYGGGFHGRRTASGRRYDMHELTAAHRSLPFGSLVRVMNSVTGKCILVEITDRGPFIRRRVIDLSYAAAKDLGVSVTPVTLQALRPADLAAQIAGDSTTAVIIDAAHAFHVVPQAALEILDRPTSFTTAMRSVDASMVIAIVPAENGKGYRYAPARLTIGTPVSDTIDIATIR